MLKMNLQYFGGRGGNAARNSSSSKTASESTSKNPEVTKKSENSSNEEKEMKRIDRLTFKAQGDGSYVLNTGDESLGTVRIYQGSPSGVYVAENDSYEGITDIDLGRDVSLNEAKRIAKEWLKGKWRTVYG